MLSNIKWKQIGEPAEFSVKDNTTIPFLTMSKELTGTKRTFLCDATFEGVPVIAQIIVSDENGKQKYKEVKGFMLKEEEGMYVLPFDGCKAPMSKVEGEDNVVKSETVSKIGSEIEGTINLVKSKEKEVEKILGFSYKQLFVITGVAFAVYLAGK